MEQDNYLKLITINIERDKHYDRLIPFLQAQKADIILMQEVFERDQPFLENNLSMQGFFSVLTSFKEMENSRLGNLTLSKHPIIKTESFYYRGDGQNPPVITMGTGGGAIIARSILITECVKNNKSYCVINNHFTWTPDGHPSDNQNEDIEKLLNLLAKIPEFIMAGDFNAPRGGPIFEKIANIYQDNVPSSITTTIDNNLHKAGPLELVVDTIFTTPQYQVDGLEVVSGLSDHCAIVAKIYRK